MSIEDISLRTKLLEDQWSENDGEVDAHPRRAFGWRLGRGVLYFIAHAVLLAIYILIAWFLISKTRTNTIRMNKDDSLTYSKFFQITCNAIELIVSDILGDGIRKESWVFNAAPHLTSPYVGETRPSLDEAWHDLL